MIDASHQPQARQTIFTLAGLAVLLGLIYVLPAPPGAKGIAGYLPLHMGLETLSIVTACIVFAIGWNGRRDQVPLNVQLLACGFLGVALLDFSHMLSYDGMPEYVTPNGPEKAIHFWLAARSLAALTLLAAVVLPWEVHPAFPRWWVLAPILAGVAGLHWLFMAAPHVLPATFVPGEGLTGFKVGFEYLLVALYALAAGILCWRMRHPRQFHAAALLGAAGTMALGELFFTFYEDVTDVYNLAGHVYKLVACVYLYRAVFVQTVRQPYEQLRESQHALERLSQHMGAEHARLDNIIAGTRAGTWEWNVQTGETRFNERWAGIVGYRLSELEPVSIETWGRLSHPDDLARSNEALQAHFNQQADFYDCEVRMRHKDGHWIWVHDRGRVREWTADGKPLWMFGTHMDITGRKQAEAIHAELLTRLQELSRHAPGVLYQYRLRPDGTSHFPYSSERMRDIYGCSPEDAAQDAAPVFSVIHPEDALRVADGIRTSAATLEPWHDTYRINHPTRGERWLEGNATPQRGEDGCITWHGYIRDVTESQKDRERLQLAASVFDASQEAIMITNADRVIVDVNAAFSQVTGYGKNEALGQKPRRFSSGQHPLAFFDAIDAQLEQEGRWQGELWNRHKNGQVYATLMSIAAVRDSTGHISHCVSIFTDISGIKAHQSELDRLANHDVLTGIPNRRLLEDRLEQALAHAQRHQSTLAVCMLDLDGFKPVNDTHGHQAGDRLLIELARRLTAVLRADETVARLGGDEFVLLFRDADPTAAIERVLQVVREPVSLGEGVVVQVSGSLGISHFRPGIKDGDQLLREADQAMYQAKSGGRNRYAVFTPSPSPAQELFAG
ncbi:MASE3 domain-containing protein [Hydrogenophaga aquatica]